MNSQELYEFLVDAKGELIGLSTNDGSVWSDADFQRAREVFHIESRLKKDIPVFFRRCRNLGEYWGFIKKEYAHYEERRQYLRDIFDPFLTELEEEFRKGVPGTDLVTEALAVVNSDWVTDTWNKALERMTTDPEGAITTARTLVETVCKHVLGDEAGDKDDLPTLYSKVAKKLKLAPSDHPQEIFKRILGGCQTVVDGLGNLRNKLGDAHGKEKRAVRPSVRHAKLAVNLAGTMAMFLVETWEVREQAAVAEDMRS